MKPSITKSLGILGLEYMPKSAEELRKAYRAALMAAHPDTRDDAACDNAKTVSEVKAANDVLHAWIESNLPSAHAEKVCVLCAGRGTVRESKKPLAATCVACGGTGARS